MTEVVLFDLDNTLLPMDQDAFTKVYFQLLCQKLAPLGFEPRALMDTIWKGTAAMLRNQGPNTNEEVFWQVFAACYGKEALEHRPYFDSFYRNEFAQAISCCAPRADIPEAIRRIKAMGYRLAMVSDPIFPLEAMYARTRWAGLDPKDFEFFSGYENCRFCKPAAGFFLDAAEKLGVRPENCLMVGNDTGKDLPAEQVGMEVFLIDHAVINEEGRDLSAYPSGGFPQLLERLKR